MDLTTGLTTTHHSAVNLPFGTSVAVRVQAVNTAGTITSNTVVLQGIHVGHDCMYTLYISAISLQALVFFCRGVSIEKVCTFYV